MDRSQASYVIPLLIFTGLMLVAAAKLWRSRYTLPVPGVAALLLLACAEWTLANTLETTSDSPSARHLWDMLQFIGVGVFPVGWFLLTSAYAGYAEHQSRRRLALLALLPLYTLLVVLTNSAHHLFWTESYQPQQFLPLWNRAFGPALWLYVFFATSLMLVGTLRLLRYLHTAGELFSRAATYVIAALLICWIAAPADSVGFHAFSHVSTTPLVAALAVPLLVYGMARLRQTGILPVALDQIMDGMADALIVLDQQGRLVGLNLAARQLLGQEGQPHLRGLPLTQVCPFLAGELARDEGTDPYSRELVCPHGAAHAVYDMHVSPLNDARGKPVHSIVVLRDITACKQMEESERAQRQLAEALAATGALISSTLNREEVLECLLIHMQDFFKYDAANIVLIDGGSMRVVHHTGYAVRGLEAWIHNRAFAPKDNCLLHAMLDSRQPIVVPDIRTAPRWWMPPELDWVRSRVASPISLEGDIIGFLTLESALPACFGPADGERLQAFAFQAAVAIRNAELFEQAEGHASALEQRVARRTAQLQASEARYRAIVEDQTELVCRFQPDGTLTFVNEAYCRYFAKSADELIYHSFMPKIPEEDQAAVQQHIKSLGPDCPVATYEHRVYAPDGQLRWQQWTDRAILNRDNRVVEFQSVGRDITELKQAEEELKRYRDHLEEQVAARTAELEEEIAERQRVGEQLKASLQEKEVLLKEIHHRVKNNMQVISSLLSLQSGYIQDEHLVELFRESQNRIRSMALIHERLYQSKDLSRIDFGSYMRDLVGYLRHSYITRAGDVSLVVAADPVHLSVDQAIPCGLLVNELVSNALKHAFPDGRQGRIEILLHRNDDNQCLLRIADDGIGLPDGLDLERTKSLGMQLVHSLARQIHAQLTLQVDQGTSFEIVFNCPGA